MWPFLASLAPHWSDQGYRRRCSRLLRPEAYSCLHLKGACEKPTSSGLWSLLRDGPPAPLAGWPWMCHSPGRQAGPSPAMPPLRKYRGSFVPIATSSLSHPCHSWWLHWLGHRPEPQASHFPSQDQVSSSRKCLGRTTSPGPRQPTPCGHSPLGADWLPSLGMGPRPGPRDWTEFSRPFMGSHPTLWSWALSASSSLPVTRGLMVPSTYS